MKRCLALEVDTSLSGERVTRALDRAIDVYGKPGRLVMDNGPEFTSRVFIGWALRRGIEPAWIEPGKPVQNAYAESFNARFRDECLNQHLFTTLADARELIEAWREDYNHVRPHTSLDGLSPEQFVERSSQAMACELRSSPDLLSTASSRSQTSPDPT